jgi:hypothetical protein
MSDKRKIHENAIKRKAIKLFGLGHSAVALAKELGVSAPTIRRWAENEGVAKGCMSPALITQNEDDFQIPLEADTSNPIVRILQKQELEKKTTAIANATSSPAEQYQTLVAARGIEMLRAAFNNPPVVKNMRDLKTLTEVVNGALGIGGKSGVGGRLAIDLNILTKPAAATTTVEAEIVN